MAGGHTHIHDAPFPGAEAQDRAEPGRGRDGRGHYGAGGRGLSGPSSLDARLCSLEAALYSAGRPLGLEDLKSVLGSTSERRVTKLVGQLAGRIARRGGALEVATHDDGRVSLQLRESFDDMVKQFSHRPLLSAGPLRTLSYIAFHQPVDQRQVIADRGAPAYGSLRTMG